MNHSLEKEDVLNAMNQIVAKYASKFGGEDALYDILAPDGVISTELTIYIMNRLGLTKADLRAKYFDLREKDLQIVYENAIQQNQSVIQEMKIFPQNN